MGWPCSNSVSRAPEFVTEALQKCHRAGGKALWSASGQVKVRSGRTWRIPGGTMKIVAATCSEQYSGTSALFEPSESGLPAGLLASPALVQVVRGTAYIPMVNVGSISVLLYPRTVVGSLEEVRVVSLPAGVSEVQSDVATMASQATSEAVPDQVEAVDLSALPAEDRGKVQSLLRQYSSVFSAHDGDLAAQI